MSLVVACAITFARSVVLTLLALPICFCLRDFLKGSRFRRSGWTLLLLPLVAPHMVTGYGYANFGWSLLAYPFANELLYSLLLFVAIVPLGVTMLYFAPQPPMSGEAMHCFRMMPSSGWWQRLRFRLSGQLGQAIPASCLMFLISFQDFELASLMGVSTWTVWLFDAQVGGLMLSHSVQYALLPLSIELAFVLSLLWFARKNLGLVSSPEVDRCEVGVATNALAWCYLIMSVVLFCIVPWGWLVPTGLAGMNAIAGHFAIGSDILAGCIFGFLATVLVYVAAQLLLPSENKLHPSKMRAGTTASTSSRSKTFLATFAAIPGLAGALVLSLVLLWVFQTTLLNSVYNTPLPWLIGLSLLLMPRALVLLSLYSVSRSRESEHLIRMMRTSGSVHQSRQAAELRWQTSWAFQCAAFVLLFLWAYADLTTAAMLAPPSLVTAPVRLYNLMHYGQSSVLSAMVVATFGIPIFVLLSLVGVRRPLQRLLVSA